MAYPFKKKKKKSKRECITNVKIYHCYLTTATTQFSVLGLRDLLQSIKKNQKMLNTLHLDVVKYFYIHAKQLMEKLLYPLHKSG